MGQESELLAGFEAISLEELDQRAELQRRVDTKYLAPAAVLEELLGRLRDDHDALEIDGRRSFNYESVYFDTPSLTCYHDHVEERLPRVKARSRLYVDTGTCVFEVKLKAGDDEMVKRHIDYERADHGRITAEARRFLDDALRPLDHDLDTSTLRPALTTSFERMTVAARDGHERVTCDVDVRLAAPDGPAVKAVKLRDGHVLVETKSQEGGGRFDRLLHDALDAGVRKVSLSKYRVGIGILTHQPGDRQVEEAGGYFTADGS